MNYLNNNLAKETENPSESQKRLNDDKLSIVIEQIKKDARKDALKYSDNSIVPEGGE